VNHGSLHGRYGREAKAHALDLLRRGWVDLLSSDFHGRANLRTYVDATRAWFAELDAEDTFMALASRNPLRVFRDEEPMPVSPLDVPRSALDRIRSFLHKTGGTR
jgi:tyrosine-protein phosphatase YwqE